MHKISTGSILSELILQNPLLVPVLYLTGISADFDGKTIQQICKEKAINESYLLNLLMVLTDEHFIPSEPLPSYSVLQLTALTSNIYPFFLKKLDFLISEILKMYKTFRLEKSNQDFIQFSPGLLKEHFALYRQFLSDRFDDQTKTALPHISNVYELYYSPDYTSKRADLMSYSLEFYDSKTLLLQQSFDSLKSFLEITRDSKQADLDYLLKLNELYHFHKEILAQDRIEQRLLKPLVLQMEESIITTFHKKNKNFKRNNYLSLPTDTPHSDVLSPREKEVLQLVAQGYINKEIADQLQIGLTTVISHRKNIVEKLGIKTIPGLTVYAYTQGYLDDSVLINEG